LLVEEEIQVEVPVEKEGCRKEGKKRLVERGTETSLNFQTQMKESKTGRKKVLLLLNKEKGIVQ
jgi:hypothetical protein